MCRIAALQGARWSIPDRRRTCRTWCHPIGEAPSDTPRRVGVRGSVLANTGPAHLTPASPRRPGGDLQPYSRHTGTVPATARFVVSQGIWGKSANRFRWSPRRCPRTHNLVAGSSPARPTSDLIIRRPADLIRPLFVLMVRSNAARRRSSEFRGELAHPVRDFVGYAASALRRVADLRWAR